MTTKLGKEFDIQDYLINTENNPEAFFKACVEEDLGDGSLVRRALGEMAKAKGGSARKGDRSLKAVFVQSAQPRRIT